jgi:chloramphenicol 3-O-phosphotransferase
MAEHQALSVHRGIDYDVELDTTDASPAEAAQPLVVYLSERDLSERDGVGST